MPKVMDITARLVGACHIVGVNRAALAAKPEDRKKRALPMLATLRSDWFLTMLAGFAIGGLIVVFQHPALSLAL